MKRFTSLFPAFFESEKAAGFILILCAFFSLALTNTGFGHAYTGIWNFPLGGHNITEWINDGLMTIFFLLVGLEIEREIYVGELKKLSVAMLPIIAALGGMLVPALIHYSFNQGSIAEKGFGIPMATDIAFALGILSLAGKQIPTALKIFLTALAIIDDLGAILVIAFFYTSALSWFYLLLSLGIFVMLLIMSRLKVQNLAFYLLPGIAMWYFMLQSGVHPTLSGVLLAFAIPFRGKLSISPSRKLQQFLHKPVAFIILPLFALANTCIVLDQSSFMHLKDKNSLGIIAGLFLGKPLGICLLSWLAIKTKIASLPRKMNMKHILGAGLLGGIGFTMSIFITLLAFPANEIIALSKLSIIVASILAAITGLVFLRFLPDPVLSPTTNNE